MIPSRLVRLSAIATTRSKSSPRKHRLHLSPRPLDTILTMFRTALLRSARCVAQSSTRVAQPALRTAVRSPFITSRITTPATRLAAIRCYASSSGLAQDEVTGRILDLLKNFDKVRIEMRRSIRGIGLTHYTGSRPIQGTLTQAPLKRIEY